MLFRWREVNKSAQAFEPLQRRLRSTIERGAQQTTCRRTAATCANLLKLWPALWTFLHQPQVPPTNNDAERALRVAVADTSLEASQREGIARDVFGNKVEQPTLDILTAAAQQEWSTPHEFRAGLVNLGRRALELGAKGALLAWPVAALVVHLALTALFVPREPEPPGQHPHPHDGPPAA